MALKDSLLSYYKFENNATDAHGSINGTVYGATLTSSGVNGSAYNYDGSNDYTNLGNPTALDNLHTGDWSISIWINPDVISSLKDVAGKNGGGGGFYHYIGNSTGDISFTSGYTTTNSIATSGNVVSSGEWNHIVGVFTVSNKTWSIYHNGSEVSYSAQTGGSGNFRGGTSDNFVFGAYDAVSGSRNYDGIIDEVAIWTKAVTSDEVSEIYNSGSGLFYDDWDVPSGWTGKIMGVTNPAKIDSVAVADITTINGV